MWLAPLVRPLFEPFIWASASTKRMRVFRMKFAKSNARSQDRALVFYVPEKEALPVQFQFIVFPVDIRHPLRRIDLHDFDIGQSVT